MGKDHDYGYFIVQNGKIFMKKIWSNCTNRG